MNVFVFIGIGVEYLGHFALFCLDSGNEIKLIILSILLGYLESVLQVPQEHCFIIFEA